MVPEPSLKSNSVGSAKWLVVIPFFFSGLFFLSALFTLFAPAPLFLLYFRHGPKAVAAALLTNAVTVALLGGFTSGITYIVLVGAAALILPMTLGSGRWSVESSILFTVFSVLVLGAGVSWSYSLHAGLDIKVLIQEQVRLATEQLGVTPIDTASSGDLERDILVELPSAIIIFVLIFSWANLMILIRLAPAKFRELAKISPTYFTNWKSPEWLIWPTILAAGGLVLGQGAIYDISLNLFKVFMAVYGFHGLGILSFFFDKWGIQGLVRSLAYLSVVLLMVPVLLAIGFFDLWFDFRAKFRQT